MVLNRDCRSNVFGINDEVYVGFFKHWAVQFRIIVLLFAKQAYQGLVLVLLITSLKTVVKLTISPV